MPGGDDRCPCGLRGGVGRVVADGLAGRHGAQLQNRRLEGRDGRDASVVRFERAAPVEGDARPGQIEMVARSQEHARRIGQAAPRAGEQRRDLREALQLQRVQRVSGRGAAGEVAHHQAQLDALEPLGRGGQRFRLLDPQAEAVQPGVDVQRRPQRRAAARREGGGRFQLRQAVQHRRQPGRLQPGQGARRRAVEHQDLAWPSGPQLSPQRLAFAQAGDEEAACALGPQPPGHRT